MDGTTRAEAGFIPLDSCNPFEELAELQVLQSSTQSKDQFHLDIRVTIGELQVPLEAETHQRQSFLRNFRRKELQSGQHIYRVRVRHCKLQMRSTECELRQDEKYKDVIQEGELTQQSSQKAEIQQKGEICGRASASVGVSARGLDASLGLKGGVNASSVASEKGTLYSSKKPEIRLIDHIPLGWRIGVPSIGDPFQETNDCCLSGTYFDKPYKRYPCTCTVRFKDNYTSGFLAFTLSCRDGFYVDRIGTVTRTVDSHEIDRVVDKMKSKIAGILIEKKLIDSGLPVNESGELILAMKRYEVCKQTPALTNAEVQESVPKVELTPPSKPEQAKPRDSSGRFISKKEGAA